MLNLLQTSRIIDYKLNEKGIKEVSEAKRLISDFQESLFGSLPDSRDLSIIKTKMEEVSFYTTRLIASKSENHTEVNTH